MRSPLEWVCLLAALFVGLATPSGAQSDFDSLVQKGTALSQQARYAEAIPVLQQARKLQPQHYLVNLLLGVDLLRSGRPTDAIKPLQVAAEADRKDATAMGYLGEAHTALREFALAAESFQAAVLRAPQSEEALLAWADFGLERFRAIATWLRSSAKGTAVVSRVQAEGMEDGTRSRESMLRQSADKDPDQPGIWGELGVAQVQLGLRADAENSLKIARDRQPTSSSTWQLQALMEAASGNWGEAEARLQALGSRSPATLTKVLAAWPKILLPDPVTPGSVWHCAQERSLNCPAVQATNPKSSGKGSDQLFAEERWEQLAEGSPPRANEPTLWYQRGVALAQFGDCARAIPALERGFNEGALTAAFWLEICYGVESEQAAARLQSQGNEEAVHQLRGDMLLRMKGDPAAAVAEYQEARKRNSKDPDLCERLAQAYLASGDMGSAKQAADDALALDQHRMLALRLLVVVNMSERDYLEALMALKRMLAMDPGNAWVRAQMGTAYAQSGRPEEAVGYLKPLLDAGYPDEKGALHAMMAGALRKLGREDEANNAAAEAARLANTFQEHGQRSSDDHR